MAKLIEMTLVGAMPTGQWITKWNLYCSAGSAVGDYSLRILETMGYDVNDPGSPIADSIFEQMLQLVKPTDFRFTELYARDPYDVNDFAQIAVSGSPWAGSREVYNGEPVWLCGKLKSTRTRQDIRAGYKAFLPIAEGDCDGGAGELSAGYLASLRGICNLLDDGLDVGAGIGTAFFGWAIVQKERYTTPSGGTAYRYYSTLEEQEQHLATPVTWSPMPVVASQKTRKRGVGR